MKVQASFARKEVQAYSAAGSVAEEAISAIRTVFAFGGQDSEVKRYERHLSPALKSGIKRNFMTGLGNGLMFACLYGGLALGIWFGVQMIIAAREAGTDEYTIGTIVIVFWCVSGAGFSIGGAAPHFEAISVARATASRVFAIIERKPLIDSSSEAGLRPEVMSAQIEFQDIEFSYPSRPEIKVLNGFSLKIASGESVALVGPSGCGKSTVVQLIQRFYDSTKGKVLIDDKDIRKTGIWRHSDRGSESSLKSPLSSTPPFGRTSLLGLSQQICRPQRHRECGQRGQCARLHSTAAQEVRDICGRSGSCPAVRSRESRSPERSSTVRRSCCWTRRPVLSTSNQRASFNRRWRERLRAEPL